MISSYENLTRQPPYSILIKLASLYGVTTDYLLGRARFPYAPSRLNQLLAKDYTISDLINTTLSLPSRDVNALLEYVELLKLRQHTDSPR